MTHGASEYSLIDGNDTNEMSFGMTGMLTQSRHDELIDEADRVYPFYWQNSGYRIVADQAQGSHLTDVQGRTYVDYLVGSGPLLLGHSHPAVTEAVKKQLDRGTTYMLYTESLLELTNEVSRAVPCAGSTVRFCNTGSEATMYAMRLARAYTNKKKILKFAGSLHGMSDFALTPNHGIPDALNDFIVVAPFNDIEATAELVEKHKDDLAGVIAEPMHRTIPPKDGFLTALRELTHQYEIPLIFDEVVTGFRLAYGGAQEYYGVVPDLCAQGKGLSGGYPLAAVMGRDEIMNHLYPGRSERTIQASGTMSGNPLCVAAALATLGELRKPGTYEKLYADGNRIKTHLATSFAEVGIPVQVTGEAPAFDVFFTGQPINNSADYLNNDRELQQVFAESLFKSGVIKAAQKFFISLSLEEEDLQLTEAAITKAAKDVAAAAHGRQAG